MAKGTRTDKVLGSTPGGPTEPPTLSPLGGPNLKKNKTSGAAGRRSPHQPLAKYMGRGRFSRWQSSFSSWDGMRCQDCTSTPPRSTGPLSFVTAPAPAPPRTPHTCAPEAGVTHHATPCHAMAQQTTPPHATPRHPTLCRTRHPPCTYPRTTPCHADATPFVCHSFGTIRVTNRRVVLRQSGAELKKNMALHTKNKKNALLFWNQIFNSKH